MAPAHLLFVLVALSGSLTVKAQRLGRCIDILVTGPATDRVNQCDAINEFVTCLIQELRLFKTNLSHSELSDFQNIVKKHLVDAGIECRVDFRAIIERVRNDEANGITLPPVKSIGFTGAKTIGDCLNAMIASSPPSGGIDCSLVTPYMKCVIRVTEYYKRWHTAREDTSLQAATRDQLDQFGVYCTFNIRTLSEEVARDETNAATSVTAEAVTTVPATFVDNELVHEARESTGIGHSESLEDCFSSLASVTRVADMNCTLVNQYIKCVVRVSGYQKSSHTTQENASLQRDIQTLIGLTGNHCAVDIRELSDEVSREESVRVSKTEAVHNSADMVARYNAAANWTACWEAYFPIDFRTTAPSCQEISLYVKCLIRVTQTYKASYFGKLQRFLDTEIRRSGDSCSLSAQNLVMEVKTEMGYNRAGVNEIATSLLLCLLLNAYMFAFM